VKDRVLAHNPLGALYASYYRDKKFGAGDPGPKRRPEKNSARDEHQGGENP